MQSLHPDFETTLPNTDYFFLGTGKLQTAIQWSRHPGATRLGVLLSDPEHFSRKWSTHLFHPEYGLDRTMLTIILNGVRYQPNETTKAVWYPGERPSVVVMWQAGEVWVIETFWVGFGEPVLFREISIGADNPFDSAEVEVALYGNPALFSEFVGNDFALGANGRDSLQIMSKSPGVFHERTLTIPLEVDDNIYRGIVSYSIGDGPSSNSIQNIANLETAYWELTCNRWTEPHPSELHHDIERIFTASAMGLRAAVGGSGRFDASLWQYGYEWSGDASMVAEALVYSGQFEVAQLVLENILTRMTIDQGMAMESSRFRGGKDAELNNNGEILKACRTYMDWTGDNEFIEEHYPRIKAIADYLLLPEYLNEDTGLLMASRDIWERNEATGILPGYDIAHQTFGILGLRDASFIADALGEQEDAVRWTIVAQRMRESFLNHPTHSLVEDGRFIKRRLLDGSVQTGLMPKTNDADFLKNFVPKGMPLASAGMRRWEPDISECLPIALGVVDPSSAVARNTIDALEELWSQAWEGGGYGRYNMESEPDSPGPWPFATAFMAAACIESDEVERAQRAINWLIEKAGAGGSWFEFYGDRPTPPLPPTGIIVWGWAQWITLVVRHLIGARVKDGELVIQPRLGGFNGEIRFRDSSVRIL